MNLRILPLVTQPTVTNTNTPMDSLIKYHMYGRFYKKSTFIRTINISLLIVGL